MPIFEYRCKACDHRFEALVRGSESPSCPECDGIDLAKQLSVFAVGGPSASANRMPAAAGACGTCGDPRGPGACSLN
jgi:putative FmdB family regulatory protein